MYIDILLEVFKKMKNYLTYEIMTANIDMNKEQRNIYMLKVFQGLPIKTIININNWYV